MPKLGAAPCCDDYDRVLDVAGGKYVARIGDEAAFFPYEFGLKRPPIGPKGLCLLALFCILLFILIPALTCVFADCAQMRSRVPWYMIWLPFFLIGQASVQVTRVSRDSHCFFIAQGWNEGWQVPLSSVVAVGVGRTVCCRTRPNVVCVLTNVADDMCCGKKSYEFELLDAEAFIADNF
eukprot:CAMPEP_0119286782 /NCGR_PEP_ID=MMETSP1329-20130426/34456_1 /TAXON_ID=114041 /ORGANISM="Genus nov. species nov., Strain RCC1024" /LENGTH=178 /DNA_ID=CAMNT_0007287527 /DNA_START=142 /DNA_END=675 /DNA_ORIENTATION=-